MWRCFQRQGFTLKVNVWFGVSGLWHYGVGGLWYIRVWMSRQKRAPYVINRRVWFYWFDKLKLASGVVLICLPCFWLTKRTALLTRWLRLLHLVLLFHLLYYYAIMQHYVLEKHISWYAYVLFWSQRVTRMWVNSRTFACKESLLNLNYKLIFMWHIFCIYSEDYNRNTHELRLPQTASNNGS
jgi:hypothetical protein